MNIEINNKTEYEVSEKEIKKVFRAAFDFLTKEEFVFSGGTSVSLALVGEEEIGKINAQYRGKNEPTDVLSFCYEKEEKIISGEIILCPEVIAKNAKEDQVEFTGELNKNIIHGILHIVGFEHSEKMFAIQEGILKIIK